MMFPFKSKCLCNLLWQVEKVLSYMSFILPEKINRKMYKWQHWEFLVKYSDLSGEGNCNSLQYSCLENPMDGGAWWTAVHGVAKSQTWLSDFTFTFHLHALEKEMATHSSVLAWRIPGMGEHGGLPSMGLHRIRHDWSDLAAAAAAAAAAVIYLMCRLV